MALEDTDLFLVNRNDTTYTQQRADIMANLEDTDYLLVNRNNATYKITGAEFKGSFEGVIVTSPTISSSSSIPASTITATAAVVSGATKDPSYNNWYRNDVAIANTAEQLVYEATLSGTYKYEERWVDSNNNELFPSAQVVIQQAEIAKPVVIAPGNGAGEGVDINYYPKTSDIDTLETLDGTWTYSSFPQTSDDHQGTNFYQVANYNGVTLSAQGGNNGAQAIITLDGQNWSYINGASLVTGGGLSVSAGVAKWGGQFKYYFINRVTGATIGSEDGTNFSNLNSLPSPGTNYYSQPVWGGVPSQGEPQDNMPAEGVLMTVNNGGKIYVRMDGGPSTLWIDAATVIGAPNEIPGWGGSEARMKVYSPETDTWLISEQNESCTKALMVCKFHKSLGE